MKQILLFLIILIVCSECVGVIISEDVPLSEQFGNYDLEKELQVRDSLEQVLKYQDYYQNQ